ncbi:hypothetical protein ACHAXT_007816 [Thalassiosira profunda]
MPITHAKGVAYANKLMAAFAAGFAKNNHAETTAGFFADELAWDWSDGTTGEGKLSEIMGIMAKSWGAMVDSFHPLNTTTIVDTDRSILFISCDLIINITGGLADENNPVHNAVVFVVHLDGGGFFTKKKIVKWEGYWDQKNPGFGDAFGRIMPKLGMDAPVPPASPMPITAEAGEAYAAAAMAAFAAGFKNNNHLETMAPYIADKVAWNWTDRRSSGEGAKEDVLGPFAESWGLMVDSFLLPNPIVVVDTDHSVITVAGELVINVTGGLATENNAVHNDIAMVFTLDKSKKATKWDIFWDNNNPEMNAALAKVSAKLGAANCRCMFRTSFAYVSLVPLGTLIRYRSSSVDRLSANSSSVPNTVLMWFGIVLSGRIVR